MYSREWLCTWKRCREAETEIGSVYRGRYFSVLSGVQMDKQERMEVSNHFLSFSKMPPPNIGLSAKFDFFTWNHQSKQTFSTCSFYSACESFYWIVWSFDFAVVSLQPKMHKWWTDFSRWLKQSVASAMRSQEATWSESSFHSVFSNCLLKSPLQWVSGARWKTSNMLTVTLRLSDRSAERGKGQSGLAVRFDPLPQKLSGKLTLECGNPHYGNRI